MNTQITLDLHGANAPKGINVSDLERFLAEFRAALRVFSREQRQHQPKVAGRPSADDDAATALRLTSLTPGSAIMELTDAVPAATPDGAQAALDVDVSTTATENLVRLVRAIDADAVSPPVGAALSKARRALGPSDGYFGIAVAGRSSRVQIDRERIERWDLTASTPVAADISSIAGRLHAFETEDPPHFELRDQHGDNWSCVYDAALEPALLAAVRRLVTLRGRGSHERSKRAFTVEAVHLIPEPEQSEMFTAAPVDAAELIREQGLGGPQALGSLAVPDLTDDERSAFLAAIFDA